MRFALLLVAACDPAPQPLNDGTYTISGINDGTPVDPSLPAGVAIELAGGTVKIRDGATLLVETTVTLLPEAEYYRGCPTNMSSNLLQTARVSGSFEIGPHRFDQPLLAAGCAGEPAIYLQAPASGTAGPCAGHPCIRFRR